jgi:hypothetical protein
MQHYIYRIDSLVTGHYYIGMRSCAGTIEYDRYMGGGTSLRKEQKHYGISFFKKTILLRDIPSRLEASIMEQILVPRALLSDKRCLNMKPGGQLKRVTFTLNIPTDEAC